MREFVTFRQLGRVDPTGVGASQGACRARPARLFPRSKEPILDRLRGRPPDLSNPASMCLSSLEPTSAELLEVMTVGHDFEELAQPNITSFHRALSRVLRRPSAGGSQQENTDEQGGMVADHSSGVRQIIHVLDLERIEGPDAASHGSGDRCGVRGCRRASRAGLRSIASSTHRCPAASHGVAVICPAFADA